MIRIPQNLSTKFLFLVNRSIKFISHINSYLLLLKLELTKRHCYLCDEQTQNKTNFCRPCIEDLPLISMHCKTCYLPMPSAVSVSQRVYLKEKNQEIRKELLKNSDIMCGECISKNPSFTSTICAFRYDFPIKQIIRKIKFSNERYWIKVLSNFLLEAIINTKTMNPHLQAPDLLIPIPMHKSKKKLRGFNQAELIAHYISKLIRIPLDKTILVKVQSTETQAQLNKQERLRNLKNSMQISQSALRKGLLKGKHIALIDDVMTTKATAELASRTLLKAGAKRVDIWCVARTPKVNLD